MRSRTSRTPRRPARTTASGRSSSSGTTGRAPLTSSRPGAASSETLTRINIVPDYDERVDEICGNPSRPRVLHRDPRADRRGQRPAGRRHVLDAERQAPRRLAPQLQGRRRAPHGRARTPARSRGASRWSASGPTTWPSRPTAKEVAISDSTANVVHLLDTKTGEKVGEFASGDSPHENTYSADGSKIYHASIGLVYTPGDEAVFDTDTNKGERYFQVVNAKTGEIISRVDMGQKLEQAGYPNLLEGRAPDGDHVERAQGVPAGLLLPRRRLLQPEEGEGEARHPPAQPGPERPARAVPPRLGAPRHRALRQRQAPLYRGHDVVVCRRSSTAAHSASPSSSRS